MLWSELFPDPGLVLRRWYQGQSNAGGVSTLPAPVAIITPAKATLLRVSMVGAGGSGMNNLGGNGAGCGAAFARTKVSSAPGDAFTLQVGRAVEDNSAYFPAQHSLLTRNSDSVVICKAVGGNTSTAPGAAADCIGDVKRSGGVGQVSSYPFYGGAAAGDEGDMGALGFGGDGARAQYSVANDARSPNPGGGGVWRPLNSEVSDNIAAGPGLVCIEFFNLDPGY
jgi:hypothetical protein